jgi:hypothetical protein
MRHLTYQIEHIEKVVLAKARLRKEFHGLLSLPGIGDILGLPIMLEAGDIRRFPEVGDYSSCRSVMIWSHRYEKKRVRTGGLRGPTGRWHVTLQKTEFFCCRGELSLDGVPSNG